MDKVIKLSVIFNSPECKEYIAACKNIKKFFVKFAVETPEANKRYKKALEAYRNYLDKHNIRLPVAKFPIIKKDKNTLKYLDSVIREHPTHSEYVKMTINPNWIYKNKDLDTINMIL